MAGTGTLLPRTSHDVRLTAEADVSNWYTPAGQMQRSVWLLIMPLLPDVMYSPVRCIIPRLGRWIQMPDAIQRVPKKHCRCSLQSPVSLQ
jgi:hypothetical protein